MFDSLVDTEVVAMSKRQTSPQTIFMCKGNESEIHLISSFISVKVRRSYTSKEPISGHTFKWISVQLNCVHAS